jgi:hypothetical protein
MRWLGYTGNVRGFSGGEGEWSSSTLPAKARYEDIQRCMPHSHAWCINRSEGPVYLSGLSPLTKKRLDEEVLMREYQR